MATVLQVADAVTAQINAAELSREVTAERLYVPNFDLADLKTMRVSVVPRELLIESLDRSSNRYNAKIDVAVQQKFSTGSHAEIDPLVDLVEEIVDLFRMKRLPSMPEARCIAVEMPVIYSPEMWDQDRTFTSLMTLTFMFAR